ncbi:zinc metalloprotease HtpX [bacterium]|nr:zinc metalloprotease HtpX [bacterium]
MATLYTHKDSNIRKTFLLFTVFLVFVIGVGWIFAQVYGNSLILYVAVAFSLIMNVLAYWYSDKIVLKMARAKEISKKDYRELYNIVENLSITAGLPTPKIYLVDEVQPNAFATGRDPEHGVVAVTRGLLERLDRSELEGVIAHELSHIGNRDMLISTVAVVLVGFISILSDIFMRSMLWGGLGRRDSRDSGGQVMFLIGIAASILAPIGAVLMQLAISRKREFLADASGALLTRHPEGLALALEKISSDQTPMKKAASSTTAHLWLSSPFRGRKGTPWFAKMFMTHPPTHDRTKALRGMDV